LEEAVQAFLGRINEVPLWMVYLFFFASAVLQITFPPYPGDSVLIFGGYLASTWLHGKNVQVLLPYWLGTLLCSLILYELGAWKGEKLLNMKAVSRYFPPSSQQKAKNWVLKYGIAAILLCKFIPGVNSLIIIFSGIFRYKRPFAYTGIGIASLVHNTAFFFIGKVIGDNWENIGKFLHTYNKIVISIVIAAIIIYVGSRVMARLKRKKIADTGED